MGIGKLLVETFILVALLISVFFGGVVWILSKIAYNKDYIETHVKITPEIKLTIVDNKVDTIYIYRKPKTK